MVQFPGDWRYENMELRQRVLSILLRKYGGEHPSKAMYECANEWVQKGHKITNGIVAYYRAYYKAVA